MSEKDKKDGKTQAPWRDKRADVLRENLKKRKMMQRERATLEKTNPDASQD